MSMVTGCVSRKGERPDEPTRYVVTFAVREANDCATYYVMLESGGKRTGRVRRGETLLHTLAAVMADAAKGEET